MIVFLNIEESEGKGLEISKTRIRLHDTYERESICFIALMIFRFSPKRLPQLTKTGASQNLRPTGNKN